MDGDAEILRFEGLRNPRGNVVSARTFITRFLVQTYRLDGSRGAKVSVDVAGKVAKRNSSILADVLGVDNYRIISSELIELKFTCDVARAVNGEAWELVEEKRKLCDTLGT